jgi:hypothetical protein
MKIKSMLYDNIGRWQNFTQSGANPTIGAVKIYNASSNLVRSEDIFFSTLKVVGLAPGNCSPVFKKVGKHIL